MDRMRIGCKSPPIFGLRLPSEAKVLCHKKKYTYASFWAWGDQAPRRGGLLWKSRCLMTCVHRETIQFRVLIDPLFSAEKATYLRDTMKRVVSGSSFSVVIGEY